MNIIKWLISKNFTVGKNRKIEYIVIHYTAGTTSKKNSALNMFKNTFSNPNTQASAHYGVDDFDVVCGVEDKDIAWHCGTKGSYKHKYCRNSNSIGIELCSNHNNFKGYKLTPSSDPGWYITKETKENGAMLAAMKLKEYNLPLDRVLRHFDVTGKDCPSPWVDSNKEGEAGWKSFLDLVKKYYDMLTVEESKEMEKESCKMYKYLEDVPVWAKEVVEKYIAEGKLNGKGKDETGKIVYDLCEGMVRMMVIMNK